MGCQESDVFFSKTTNMSCSSRLGKEENTESSSISEIGIRAILNKKQSIVSTTNLDKKNIEELIHKVFQMVKVVPENKYCGLAEPEDVMKFKKSDADLLKLNDPKTPTITTIKSNVLELEESALSNKLIKNSEGAEISHTHNSYYLLGSNGLEIEMEKTHSDYIIAVLASSNNSMEREYDYKSKVFFTDLGNFSEIGKEVSRNAIKKLNSRKIKTCKSDVIFDSKV